MWIKHKAAEANFVFIQPFFDVKKKGDGEKRLVGKLPFLTLQNWAQESDIFKCHSMPILGCHWRIFIGVGVSA